MSIFIEHVIIMFDNSVAKWATDQALVKHDHSLAQLTVPLLCVDVHQHGPASISDVSYVDAPLSSACQVLQEVNLLNKLGGVH